MKFATFRQPNERTDQPGATFAAVITHTETDETGAEDAVYAVAIPSVTDVGELLGLPVETRNELINRVLDEAEADPSKILDIRQATYDTLIPFPTKVFCVGLNYHNHIVETGLEVPIYPTLFAKYGQSLTSAEAHIAVPEIDHRLDYEGELCAVIGQPGKNIPHDQALEHVAGYAIANDFSLRGMQGRTDEWLAGKIFEATTPVGPWLVTPDEFDPNARLTTAVNDEIRQSDVVSDLVFDVAKLVSYISHMITLLPGDLILTGTPGGVALALRDEDGRRPWLKAGDTVETRIEGLGVQRNAII